MSITIAEQTQQNCVPHESGAHPALSDAFSVGQWSVEPQLNRIKLRSTDEERQLEPRLIKLLCFLAANEHRVLSRDELVYELWPRVVVNENSLTRAISELRKQLQHPSSTATNYIETIPKRGYRLLPRVERTGSYATATSSNGTALWARYFQPSTSKFAAGVSTACLLLLVTGWLTLNQANFLERGWGETSNQVALSDELLETTPDYFGGQLQLSTIDDTTAVVESIATPVVSLDETQYAFIQYDTRGSTIFLGGLGTAIEPVPVYASNQHLFNLAWSPVGNSLLFAMKPSVTTAAVFASAGETAELLTLNLNTLETSRLVEEINPAETGSPNGLNLT